MEKKSNIEISIIFEKKHTSFCLNIADTTSNIPKFQNKKKW